MAVIIDDVLRRTKAYHLGIRQGDSLISINGHNINDILDYLYHTASEDTLSVIVETASGRRRCRQITYTVSDRSDQDKLGLVFNDFLMDSERQCHNHCIFCFVDQLPTGMRDSVYIKDDDERLSFLFGNYLTLTNLDDKDIDRIIEMNVSPINISVHTTNGELRSFMLQNPAGADSLRFMYRLAKAGISINYQVVLCTGINDSAELEKTLDDLIELYPSTRSISVVPVGLTAHRTNLHELQPLGKQEAIDALDLVVRKHKYCREQFGTGLIYAADELFILAGIEIPEPQYYDEFPQIENGVGMTSLFESEFLSSLADCSAVDSAPIDIVTGTIANRMMSKLMKQAKQRFDDLNYRIHCIENKFFGGNVTVAGLLTATDIMNQITPEDMLGDKMLIPSSMLRSEGDIFLDDLTPEHLSKRYNAKIITVSNGHELVETFSKQEKESWQNPPSQ